MTAHPIVSNTASRVANLIADDFDFVTDILERDGCPPDLITHSAAVSLVQLLLMMSKADPEILEWVRYQLTSDDSAGKQRGVGTLFASEFRALRAEIESDR